MVVVDTYMTLTFVEKKSRHTTYSCEDVHTISKGCKIDDSVVRFYLYVFS